MHLCCNPAYDQIVHLVICKHPKELTQVEGAFRGSTHDGTYLVAGWPALRASAPAISNCVATRFHEAASRSRSRALLRTASPAASASGSLSKTRRSPSSVSRWASRSSVGDSTPRSIRLIASWLVRARTASSRWLTPCRLLASRSNCEALLLHRIRCMYISIAMDDPTLGGPLPLVPSGRLFGLRLRARFGRKA